MKPDFIVIGTQKAGTTWLYEQLNNHPEVMMPPQKEIHYFDRSLGWDTGYPSIPHQVRVRMKEKRWLRMVIIKFIHEARRGRLGNAFWYTKWHLRNHSDAWYRSLFKNRQNLVSGDISPEYVLLDEKSCAHMHSIASHAKIVLLLRNPIDRAWSMMKYENHYITVLDLEDTEALKAFADSRYQDARSDYETTLSVYLKFFKPKQILIGFYDAISEQPQSLMDAVTDHLGISRHSFRNRDLDKRVNYTPALSPPSEIQEYLKEKYRPRITRHSELFGSYANHWLAQLDGNTGENQDIPPATVRVDALENLRSPNPQERI